MEPCKAFWRSISNGVNTKQSGIIRRNIEKKNIRIKEKLTHRYKIVLVTIFSDYDSEFEWNKHKKTKKFSLS